MNQQHGSVKCSNSVITVIWNLSTVVWGLLRNILFFSTGQRKSEALQASKVRKWLCLRVKDQTLRNNKGTSRLLHRTGQRSLCASGWTMQKGNVYMNTIWGRLFYFPTAPLTDSSVQADADRSSSNLRPVLQHGGSVGNQTAFYRTEEEVGSRTVWWSLWGSVERDHIGSSKDPQTRYIN